MKPLLTLLASCCFTMALAQEIKLNSPFYLSSSEKPLFVVNGERIAYDDLSHIEPNDIESIEVLKNQKAIDQFGEAGKNGVVLITLKGFKKPDETQESMDKSSITKLESFSTGAQSLFILDGKIIQHKDLEKIDTRTIESVEVLTGEKAIEQYGDKGKNGVIVITSKKAPMKIRQTEKN
jgi:bla regulator protein BlaR1